MNPEQDKQRLLQKLERYRRLSAGSSDVETLTALKGLIIELEAKISALDAVDKTEAPAGPRIHR